jgi:hypothetical protein
VALGVSGYSYRAIVRARRAVAASVRQLIR